MNERSKDLRRPVLQIETVRNNFALVERYEDGWKAILMF